MLTKQTNSKCAPSGMLNVISSPLEPLITRPLIRNWGSFVRFGLGIFFSPCIPTSCGTIFQQHHNSQTLLIDTAVSFVLYYYKDVTSTVKISNALLLRLE